MSAGHGVPDLPASLRDVTDPEMAGFVDIWRSVLLQEESEGLRPFSGPHTVLAVSGSSMDLAVPCDLPNPFRVDSAFQRKFLGRHVLLEPVPPGDERFSSGGRVTTLDGGELTLAEEDGRPTFAVTGETPVTARHVPGKEDDVVVYQVEGLLVSFDEVMEAVRRHKPRPYHPRSLTDIIQDEELKAMEGEQEQEREEEQDLSFSSDEATGTARWDRPSRLRDFIPEEELKAMDREQEQQRERRQQEGQDGRQTDEQMSESRGVPYIPASLRDTTDEEMADFVDIWVWVQYMQREEGLRPFPGPYTVLAVPGSSMGLAVPCDLPDPFRVDSAFQRKFMGRHVLTELVPPGDERFSSGGRVTTLDGGELTLAEEDGKPTFTVNGEGNTPVTARHVPGKEDDVVVYQVDSPLIGFDDIMEGVRRHNPRPWYRTLSMIEAELEQKLTTETGPEPEPGSKPESEPEQEQQ